MISLDKIEESILEIEQKDTCFVNCEKLAWLYIVRDHLKQYKSQDSQLEVSGDSEFLKAVNDKNSQEVWNIIDEAMDTLQALHPRIYNKVIERIRAM